MKDFFGASHQYVYHIPSSLLETSCVNESEQNLGERKTKEKKKIFCNFPLLRGAFQPVGRQLFSVHDLEMITLTSFLFLVIESGAN